MIESLSATRRWSRMHCIKDESVLEHTGFVALYTLHLCTKHGIDYGLPLKKAVVHDIEESKVGDISTPTKYHNQELTAQIKIVEDIYALQISNQCFNGDVYEEWVDSKNLYTISGCVVAIADAAASVYKIKQEVSMGNRTFISLIPNINDSLWGLQDRVVKMFRDDIKDLIETLGEIE